MMKRCSVLFTIGWAMALVFGGLAIFAPASEDTTVLVINILLAFAGVCMGAFSWSRIIRGC